jgi:type IV secretory pathway VirB10-like protein
MHETRHQPQVVAATQFLKIPALQLKTATATQHDQKKQPRQAPETQKTPTTKANSSHNRPRSPNTKNHPKQNTHHYPPTNTPTQHRHNNQKQKTNQQKTTHKKPKNSSLWTLRGWFLNTVLVACPVWLLQSPTDLLWALDIGLDGSGDVAMSSASVFIRIDETHWLY